MSCKAWAWLDTFRLGQSLPVPAPLEKDNGGDGHQDGHRQTDEGLDLVAAEELPQAVHGAGAPGQDRLRLQMPPNVFGQTADGLVPPDAVLLQRLHHDPVQVAPDLS